MESGHRTYTKLPSDDYAVVEDAQYVVQDNRSWLRKNTGYVTFHTTLVLLYALLTFTILHKTNLGVCPEQESGSPLTYSPARDFISYEPLVFNAAPNLTSPYVGENRPSLDRAWHELLRYTNMRITVEDLEQVNRSSIPLGKGDGYYGELAVFHELHCLKFIRQAFHMDYYSHTWAQRERETMAEHTEHCIEILRQSVMCRGDTTLITFHWGHTVKLPQPDFTLEHECIKWDSLMGWAEQHSINVFEDGMLVHPTLGPAYPGGQRDDRPPPSDAMID